MAQPETRAELIRQRLIDALDPITVDVVDNSAAHAGHPGAAGGGHFRVLVVADRFEGLSRVAAQRLVYQALDGLLAEDIHAIEMRTLTPAQWAETERPGG